MAASFLTEIEERLRKRRRTGQHLRSRHYDSGLAIDLRYNPVFYSVAQTSHALQDLADRDSDEAVFGTGELEDLEEEEAQEEERQESVAQHLRGRSLSEEAEPDFAVWGTGELEFDEASEFTASLSGPPLDEATVWGTGELEDPPTADSVADAQGYASPKAAAFARRLGERQLLDSEDPDTRAFAQDLQSILAGRKDHPSTAPTRTIYEQEEDTERAEAPASSDGRAYPSAFSHGVFDRMGPGMEMAKTFDLGSYDLSGQFDAFDRQLDQDERTAERRRHAVRQQRRRARDAEREFAEDLSAISGLPTPSRARAFDAPPTYDLTFDVPLVPQQTSMSCWAAGAAMLVAWRDQLSVDPFEIANAAGAWAAYQHGLQPNDASIFPVWGMVEEPPQSYTVQAFYDLLDRYGPLWVAGGGPHIRVVTGVRGDGTADGTTLLINDPWEAGMTEFRLPNAGARYTRTYAQFVSELESLALREKSIPGAIYVARLREPRHR